MKNKWLTLLIGLLVLVGGVAVWRVRAVNRNEQDAALIVRHWLAAQPQASFTGTEESEFRIGRRLIKSQALVARRPHMRRIRYLTPPLVAGVTIWRDNEKTYTFDPKGRQLEIFDKSLHHHGAASHEEALVLRNYQPQWEGVERIAGRPAYRICLAPRHAGDAWERVWIDRVTSFRLGDEDYDGDNRLLRSTRFLRIRFDAVNADQFRPPPYVMSLARRTYSDEAQSKSVAQVSQAVGFPVVLPPYMPPGYVFDGAYTYPCRCGCEKPAAQVCWTNGLKTISMFECGDPCGHGAACAFTANGHASGAAVRVGKESFLFVGETRPAELNKMAQSLKSHRFDAGA